MKLGLCTEYCEGISLKASHMLDCKRVLRRISGNRVRGLKADRPGQSQCHQWRTSVSAVLNIWIQLLSFNNKAQIKKSSPVI